MKKPPNKAVILAAGFGSRMLPLTRIIPKPLLPLWNVPMLEHALRLVERWGVREVLVNCHHKADQVVEFLRERASHKNLRIAISYEPNILGTGGVLRNVEWFFDDQPFWLFNADVAADVLPHTMMQQPPTRRTPACLWLVPDCGPRTVAMKRGMVQTFHDLTPGTVSTYTFSGLHLVHPSLLNFLPATGFASIIAAYERAMADGLKIRGVVCPDSYWADIGTPEQFVDAHRELLRCKKEGRPGAWLVDDKALSELRRLKRRGISIKGFVAIAPDAEVVAGAKLQDAVLLPGSAVGARGRVRNAIVAPDVLVQSNVERMVISAEFGLEAVECRAMQKLGWNTAKTTASLSAFRGSSRQFVRLCQGRRKAMLVRYKAEREENKLYVLHARFLCDLGLLVPHVLMDDPENEWALLNDLGTRSLLSIARHGSAARRRVAYHATLEKVACLHRDGMLAARKRRLPLMAPFDAKLYRWEHELFAKHILQDRLQYSRHKVNRVLRELASVSAILLQQSNVLLHRDLQSTNVFFVEKEPALIDFQGMRFGPAAYDVASLLADPYVFLSRDTQLELLTSYNQLTKMADIAVPLFDVAVVQRLTQALGAFGRLAKLPGQEPFARYIEPSATRLMAVSERLSIRLDCFCAALVGCL